MLNNIGWDGRLHRWRGSKTCLQAFLSETGIPQIFSLWVVQIVTLLPKIKSIYYERNLCN